MSTETRKYELRERAKRQEETRERIVKAAAELHDEVGPAETTVAEVARRAGVSRLTVYNHFPDEGELFGACSARFIAENPLPDLGPLLEAEDPGERLRGVLAAIYGWYRRNESMVGNVERDRTKLPALDAVLSESRDAALGGLAEALAAGLAGDGARPAKERRALVNLALDFWTWRRLRDAGLGDRAAARLMGDVAAA